MQPLEVRLFGGFALRRGGESVAPIATRVGRSVFAYLALNLGIALPRERLVSEFWPDQAESRGRRRLSHTLWQLQDALSELPGASPYLDVGPDTLALGTVAPVTVDAVEFERGLDTLRHLRSATDPRFRDLAQLEQVVELYQGDLLDGHYEPWVRAEQERLGQRYLEALSTLVLAAKRLGAYDDALIYARRLTHQDPLREDGHREVMRLSMLLGRPGEALRQYERCREVLAEDLSTSPSPATTELYERIPRHSTSASARVVAPTPIPAKPPLVGRDRERAAALAVAETALRGRGGAVLVEGGPGMGKSRLLQELVDDAGWRGFVAVEGRCRGPSEAGPFELARELIEAALDPLRVEHLRTRLEPVWLAEVARLVPALGRAVPKGGRGTGILPRGEGADRMRAAVVQVLLALSDVDPLCLVIDNVHWADSDSLAVLAAVAGELREHRSVLVLGYRGDEARSRQAVWDMVQELDRELRPARLLLEPLDAFSIGELARLVAGGYPIEPAAAARLCRETGGNPLFVFETLRELADQGQLSALAEGWTQLPLPTSIRGLILGRIQRLPAEMRAVLDAAAVIGDGADLDLLGAVTEVARSALATHVDDLLRGNLLRDVDGAYGVYHAQIRRTCLEALDPPTAEALHLRVGEALEQQHPHEVERIAYHLESAGHGRRAVSYLIAAGRRAVSLHAYAAAEGFLQRAADQQRGGPFRVEDRFELLVELEDVLDVLGERGRQHEVIEELAELAGEEVTLIVEVTRLRASLQALLGDPVDAIELADDAVALAESVGEPKLLARSVRCAANVHSWAGRRAEAVPLWERAITMADGPQELAESRTMLASTLRELHRYAEAAAELQVALRLAAEAGLLREEARALGVLGSIRMETGDPDSAADLYRRSLERCTELGFRRGERINLINLGVTLIDLGDVRGALEAFDRAEDIVRSLGDRLGLAMLHLNQGVARFEVLGDDEAAEGMLQEALGFFEESEEVRFSVACHAVLAGIALRHGDLDEAERQIAAAESTSRGQVDAWVHVPLLQRRAMLAAARGAFTTAIGHAREALRLAEEHELVGKLPKALALLGHLHLESGETATAVDLTGRAVSALVRGSPDPHLVHLAHHDALAAAARPLEARDAALTAAERLTAILDTVPPEDRERAEGVPEHERILDLAARLSPSQATVEVAGSDAPIGRALRASELVEVRVELDPLTGPPDPVERRRATLASALEQIAAQGGAPTVADLARLLDVSEATVRRDLATLRDRGVEVATRGSRTG